jgi:hypothetical protein
VITLRSFLLEVIRHVIIVEQLAPYINVNTNRFYYYEPWSLMVYLRSKWRITNKLLVTLRWSSMRWFSLGLTWQVDPGRNGSGSVSVSGLIPSIVYHLFIHYHFICLLVETFDISLTWSNQLCGEPLGTDFDRTLLLTLAWQINLNFCSDHRLMPD